MQKNIIYEEKVMSKVTTVTLGFFAACLLFLFLYQNLIGPVGTRPAPDWLILGMFLFILCVAINFSKLTISMTQESMCVAYGIFKRNIRWVDIEECFFDTISEIRYGGWGIRFVKAGGKWRLVYSVFGGARVVLKLKKGRFNEFAFSTKNPEEVIKIINQKIRL